MLAESLNDIPSMSRGRRIWMTRPAMAKAARRRSAAKAGSRTRPHRGEPRRRPAQGFLQARCELAQDQVAGTVAEPVIGSVESVEVEDQQGDGLARALDLERHLSDPVEQERSIRQAGQAVVEGLASELLVRLALRDVPDDATPIRALPSRRRSRRPRRGSDCHRFVSRRARAGSVSWTAWLFPNSGNSAPKGFPLTCSIGSLNMCSAARFHDNTALIVEGHDAIEHVIDQTAHQPSWRRSARRRASSRPADRAVPQGRPAGGSRGSAKYAARWSQPGEAPGRRMTRASRSPSDRAALLPFEFAHEPACGEPDQCAEQGDRPARDRADGSLLQQRFRNESLHYGAR